MININFIQIPTKVIRDKNIRDVDKFVYGVILYRSHGDGFCWSSNKDIAEQIGVSPSSISDCTARLEKEGYIIKEQKNSLKRKLIPQIIVDTIDLSQITNQPTSNNESTIVKQREEPSSNDEHNIIYNNIYNIIKKFNPIIYSMRGYSSQLKACEAISKQENWEEILNWYAAEYVRVPRDKFLPLANIPTKLVEKWQTIKEYWESKTNNGLLTNFSVDDIINKYNKQ